MTFTELQSSTSHPAHTLVLIHAFPLSGEMWRETVSRLKEDSLRIIAAELPGFGKAPTAPWTMEEAAEEIYQYAQQEDLSNLVLCGLSMGGYVALTFYRKYPDIVEALVLADTKAAADTPEAREQRFVFAKDALARGAVAAEERMLSKMTAPGADSRVVDLVRSWFQAAQPEAIANALHAMADRSDSTELLPLINVPTLVIAGEHDAITSANEMQGMAAAIQGSKFVVIPDAGHLSAVEKPSEFAGAIHGFLQSLD